MLASVSDYMYWWQLLLLPPFLLGWLMGGAWLLQRSLRQKLENLQNVRKIKRGRCVLAMFLSGGAGALTCLVTMVFVGTFTPSPEQKQIFMAIGGALGILPGIAIALLVLYAFFDMSLTKTLSVGWMPLGATALLTIVLGAAAIIPALGMRQDQYRVQTCQSNLNKIWQGLVTFEAGQDSYAKNLDQLVEKNLVGKNVLGCCGLDGPRFFYFPRRIERVQNTDSLLLCDRKNTHSVGRNVIYVNGFCRMTDEKTFQDLLAKPENKGFAEALAAVEK